MRLSELADTHRARATGEVRIPAQVAIALSCSSRHRPRRPITTSTIPAGPISPRSSKNSTWPRCRTTRLRSLSRIRAPTAYGNENFGSDPEPAQAGCSGLEFSRHFRPAGGVRRPGRLYATIRRRRVPATRLPNSATPGGDVIFTDTPGVLGLGRADRSRPCRCRRPTAVLPDRPRAGDAFAEYERSAVAELLGDVFYDGGARDRARAGIAAHLDEQRDVAGRDPHDVAGAADRCRRYRVAGGVVRQTELAGELRDHLGPSRRWRTAPRASLGVGGRDLAERAGGQHPDESRRHVSH